MCHERLAVNDTGDVIRAVDSQHHSPTPQCRRCDNASSEVFSTSCSSVERYETAVGPTSARKPNTKLQEVDPTAVVFGPGAAVNESNHLALRN